MIGPLDRIYYWTRDLDEAVAFYRDVVGLELVDRRGDGWAEFEAGPVRFALHGAGVAGIQEVPVSGTIVLRVDDLDAARWTLRERGATFDEADAEVTGFARFATFRDPDGNPIQIIEYLREADPRTA
jgi:predicted enzyme related to lactoylglutathione lyase